jgi:hypothetical protein
MLPKGMNATALKGDRFDFCCEEQRSTQHQTAKSSAGRKQSTWSYSRHIGQVASKLAC